MGVGMGVLLIEPKPFLRILSKLFLTISASVFTTFNGLLPLLLSQGARRLT